MSPLPSKNHVLAACRGDIQDDHPVLRWTSELGEVHRRRLTMDPLARNEIEQRRRALIHEIDRWVTRRLPPSLGCARLHTESIGTVIDRLSKFTAHAEAALSGKDIHALRDIWERLAELAVGYDDLEDEVSTGRRRLPCTH